MKFSIWIYGHVNGQAHCLDSYFEDEIDLAKKSFNSPYGWQWQGKFEDGYFDYITLEQGVGTNRKLINRRELK